jgi:hypothetical protein
MTEIYFVLKVAVVLPTPNTHFPQYYIYIEYYRFYPSMDQYQHRK